MLKRMTSIAGQIERLRRTLKVDGVPLTTSETASIIQTLEAYDKDRNRLAYARNLLRRLLNKVNLVTAPHRHGQEIPKNYLDQLANRQIEVEEGLGEVYDPSDVLR